MDLIALNFCLYQNDNDEEQMHLKKIARSMGVTAQGLQCAKHSANYFLAQ